MKSRLKTPEFSLVPGEGFEPSVEDPKSSALPLGHPGASSTLASVRVTSDGARSFSPSMKALVLVGLLAVTAACGAYQFPGQTPLAGDAHVSGTVRSVPCAPVEQDGSTCSGRPVPKLEVDYLRGSTIVGRTVTDGKGAYSVELPAGEYTVKLNTYMRIISGPTKLSLGPDTQTVADYVVDNGIRVPEPQPAST